MIDRHYGHLARDGREHAPSNSSTPTRINADVHTVGAAWTSKTRVAVNQGNQNSF
jgi:hypothetical protein